MNDLNAQQIVLLCLLVSFVSSIATGITTVSLLDQAPDPVSQTINRVVEKTIERVVEQPPEGSNEQPVERIVETVVVNQEDLTVDAVQKNSRSLVRIYTGANAETRQFQGLGVVVSDTGRIIVDISISGLSQAVGVFQSGEFDLRYVDTTGSFGIYEVADAGTATFSPATISSSDSVQLAQTVILLSGRESNVVSTGIVTDLDVVDDNNPETANAVSNITASVDVTKVMGGSILLNLKGEIVGIKKSSDSGNVFTPSSKISQFLASVEA